MKFEPNEKYNTIAVYSLIVIFIITGFAACAFHFGKIISWLKWIISIFKPIIYGFVFAFIFFPLLSFFETKVFTFSEKKSETKALPFHKVIKRTGIIGKFIKPGSERKSNPGRNLSPIFSLIATYMVVIAVISLFVLIIVPQAVLSYTDLSEKFSGYVVAANNFIDNITGNLPKFTLIYEKPPAGSSIPILPTDENGQFVDLIVTRIQTSQGNELYHNIKHIVLNSTTFDLSESLGGLLNNSYNIITDLTPHILSIIKNIFTETKNILLGLIISVYYLASRKKIFNRTKQTVESLFPEKTAHTIFSTAALINDRFISFINGKLIDAVIIGMLCSLLMTIFKMPYAPIIGLLVGVTNVIPYLGPFLGAIPGAFIIFVSDPYMTIWFILMIIAIQQLDSYFIEPHILRSQVNLSAVWIILSVIIMGGLFDIVGMFLGVPIVSIMYTLIKRGVETLLEERGLPISTEEWMKKEN